MPFIVGQVKSIEGVIGKDKLKKLQVDIGGDSLVTIVTNAPNVRDNTRTVIATLGTEIEYEGSTIVIERTNVAGIYSEGMVCDSIMLGWSGGAAGIAVQVPDSFSLGSAAPSSKPRMDGKTNDFAEPVVELTAKELKAIDKAKRAEIMAAKKAARKAAKESGKAEDTDDVEEGEK